MDARTNEPLKTEPLIGQDVEGYEAQQQTFTEKGGVVGEKSGEWHQDDAFVATDATKQPVIAGIGGDGGDTSSGVNGEYLTEPLSSTDKLRE